MLIGVDIGKDPSKHAQGRIDSSCLSQLIVSYFIDIVPDGIGMTDIKYDIAERID